MKCFFSTEANEIIPISARQAEEGSSFTARPAYTSGKEGVEVSSRELNLNSPSTAKLCKTGPKQDQEPQVEQKRKIRKRKSRLICGRARRKVPGTTTARKKRNNMLFVITRLATARSSWDYSYQMHIFRPRRKKRSVFLISDYSNILFLSKVRATYSKTSPKLIRFCMSKIHRSIFVCQFSGLNALDVNVFERICQMLHPII